MEYSADPYEFGAYTKVLYPGLELSFWPLFWQKVRRMGHRSIDGWPRPVFDLVRKIDFFSMIIGRRLIKLP